MADGEEGIGRQVIAGAGEWEGWTLIRGGDPFEDLTGPFYMREEPDGTRRSAFRAETKHLNGSGNLHGGCLMTFADFSLFMIAHEALNGVESVTVSLNGEFVGPAREGDLIESAGQVVRAGRSLVFIRGIISSGGEPMLSFSGVVKKLRPRST
ncbi:MAG: PaaI family thioesterase [Caulobacteraceae bacterium]|nr:PaaI family thioesterase [Caulobacteraceae bacterium]